MRISVAICIVTLCALGAGDSAGAAPLYSNAGVAADTPALNATNRSLSGVFAPAGAAFSEVQASGSTEANMIGGLSAQSMEVAGAYRFADDFVVPAEGWLIEGVSFFAYQPGAMGPVGPFAAVNVRIWNARPSSPGAAIVFGDTLTNRLIGISSTSTYRIFNSVVPPFASVPTTTRLVWRLDAAMHKFLAGGTYWLDFQIEPVDPALDAFVPMATRAGVRTIAGFNALQYRSSTVNRYGAWESILDPGKPASAADVPQDVPFLISGTIGCAGDINHDLVLDFNDYLDFVDAISLGAPLADFNHDGVIDFNDYLDFVDALSLGC